MIRPSNNAPLPKRLLSEHIDYTADHHMVDAGRETVKDRYLVQNEKSPQDAYMRCATAFASNEAHALRMYGYFKNHHAGPASPVLANAPVRIKFFKITLRTLVTTHLNLYMAHCLFHATQVL